MKNLKKFAALLLVGAMALLMLTACGGGGGSVNNPEEQKVLTQIGNQKGVQVTNDAQLRAVAKAQLDEDLNGQFNVFGYAGAFRIYPKPVGNDLVVTITARYDYKDTFLNLVLTEISKHVDREAPAPFCVVTKAAGKAKAAACLPKGTRLLFVCLVHRHRKPPEVSLPTVLCMMIGGSKNDRHIIAA